MIGSQFDFRRQMKAVVGATLGMTLVLLVGAAEDLTNARRLFEAGKYQEAIDLIATIDGDAQNRPRLQYLKAQSRERLGDAAAAERAYGALASSDTPAWRLVGQSALAFLHRESQEALDAASQAVAADATLSETQYQLGLALSANEDYAKAAAAFDMAAELDPQWAHTWYYAGLAYSKVRRIDLLAARFTTFLKLAPNAPERPEVESIMRTIRGR